MLRQSSILLYLIISEAKMDVCPKCFSGYYKSEMFNHSDLHLQQLSHPIVMNIKEQKVVEDLKDKEPVEITN